MRLFLLLILTLAPSAVHAAADLVIYGGTPAGLSAGIAAAREGASVVIIEPTRWIGGLVTGGLTHTDKGKEETIGGLPREFFTRAAAKPGTPMWYAEPQTNMATFQVMLTEAGVKVITGQSLQSITKTGTRITSLTTTDGATHEGSVFIDATYEGDLMAKAAVSYIVGRESSAQYGESLAGFHPMPIRPRTVEVMESDCPGIGGTGPSYIHGTPASIPALDDKGEPIFGVYRADPKLKPGDADNLTQAYNFRICVTQRPDIFVPFPKPAHYDAARYELLARLIKAFPGIRFGRLFHLGKVAGDKYDLNAQGLFSTDYPGANTAYPDGDAATRARIWQDHIDYIQGMLWFLGHDERVPKALRDQTNSWGLCKDEFTDNNHWPYALYVREGRRMIGEYVMTQKDLQTDIFKDDSVGMGSFVIDCHIVQRIVAEDGTIRDEGSFQDAPALPYQIPYRSLTPKRTECENLLVPVCLSASHIAYCSLRMEPVYMALGHASGLAAVMAKKANTSVQAIDVPDLRKKLLDQKAVLELASLANMVRSSQLPGIVMDDSEATTTGHWTGSAYGNPVNGSSRHDENTDKGAKSITYTLKVPAAGRYEVRLSYAPAANRASNVPVTIQHAESTAKATLNQRKEPPIDKLFVSLGTFPFAPTKPAVITISTENTNGYVGADCVQLMEAK
ncbi:MAG TPA: FAD-dependent oxidoreductase [Prosthecobacter sp.]|nr:FAD-dependent oxidoreductase [Prosthecobacter sp.]